MIFFFIQSNSSKQLDCFRVKEEDMDELRMQFMGTGAGEGIPTPFVDAESVNMQEKQVEKMSGLDPVFVFRMK